MRTLKLSAFSLGTLFWMAVPIVSAQPRDWGPYSTGWHFMWGGMGIGMFFFMILFWGLVIAGGVMLVRWLWSGGSGSQKFPPFRDDAQEILKTRFAKGEIDAEEFQSKMETLQKS